MSNLTYGELVSVVVPTYNHEQYIEETLDSVYRQGYKNLELIVLDDCSKDKTFELAKQWALQNKANDRFARIIIEKNDKNLGAHNTINKGISLTSGNALTILNSDDVYAYNRIEEIMQIAEKGKADWLFTGLSVINEMGKKLSSELAAEIESFADFAGNYPSVSFALLRKNIAATTGNLFFSRELYNRVGPFRNLRYCHDWDFSLQACLVSEPIFMPQQLYNYRIHSTNSFSSLKEEKALEPQIIYWHYFAACRAGNIQNPHAPWLTNWPGLFEKWMAEDEVLSGAYYLVGDEPVKFDRLAQSINYTVEQANSIQ